MHREDQYLGVRIHPYDFARGFDSTHHGHGYVHHNGVGFQFIGQPQGLLPIGGFSDDFPFVLGFQNMADTLTNHLMIVDDEDARSNASPARQKP